MLWILLIAFVLIGLRVGTAAFPNAHQDDRLKSGIYIVMLAIWTLLLIGSVF